MSRKRSKPEVMEPSSEDEEQEGEEEIDETTTESASEEDEFDSDDERVNMIPSQDPDETPLQNAVDDSSSESDEEDDTPAMKPVSDASRLQQQQNVRTFDSDVESEYETDSTSESEGPIQKPAKHIVQGSPTEVLPPSQRKVQEPRLASRTEEDAKKGKYKSVKQQQKDSLPGKNEVLRNVQEESQSARKGHGGVMREIASDDSVKDERKSGASAKKRKLEPLQHDAERDSADSAPTSKKKKDAEVASNGKKSVSKEKAVPAPSESALDESFKSKKGTVRDKPLHDVEKEIARKTLHNGNARGNGTQGVLDTRVSNAGHELKQEKKLNSSATTQPASASKQKKPHVWSTDEEVLMALEFLNRVKMGLEVPSKRTDDFWLSLTEILREKVGLDFTRDQLSEKARRLKQRYQGTVQKIKDSQGSKKPFTHKSIAEQRLFDIMSQIWGRAEMVSLEGSQQEVANEVKYDPSESNKNLKGDQSHEGNEKAMNASSPKSRSKALASKVEVAPSTGNNVGADTNVVVAVSPKVDHVGAGKDDQAHVVLHALAADGTTPPLHDAHGLLEKNVQAMLHELQEWSKQNLEEWMNKAYALVEESTRKFEEKARRISWMGSLASGGWSLRSCDAMDIPLLHENEGIQQQWYELQLQELNLHAQRLELMRRECELKQEQIKMQLKEKSKK